MEMCKREDKVPEENQECNEHKSVESTTEVIGVKKSLINKYEDDDEKPVPFFSWRILWSYAGPGLLMVRCLSTLSCPVGPVLFLVPHFYISLLPLAAEYSIP